MEAPPKELELLACLAGHPNRVYTRDQLLDEVWGLSLIHIYFFGHSAHNAVDHGVLLFTH